MLQENLEVLTAAGLLTAGMQGFAEWNIQSCRKKQIHWSFFSLNQPLGRFSLWVVNFVYMLCVVCAIGQNPEPHGLETSGQRANS